MKYNLGNKETMAKNIRKYMELKGITAVELSEAIGQPPTTVSNWINAKTYPRIDKIEMMAKYFGVKKSVLVEEWDDIHWNPYTQEITTDDSNYYEDPEAADLAQFLHDNPGHKVLFDASRKVKSEDLEKALRAIGLFIDEE